MTTLKIMELFEQVDFITEETIENDSIGSYNYGSATYYDHQPDYIVGSIYTTISLNTLKARDIKTFFSKQSRIDWLAELIYKGINGRITDIEDPIFEIDFKNKSIIVSVNYFAEVPEDEDDYDYLLD